ncbi:MAG: TRAP transporter substrate-binding protein [Gammaproteobacteria bacterium]|nr:TRAP transporter substrate-binding protein [Gammaproteobacteria bacterium]
MKTTTRRLVLGATLAAALGALAGLPGIAAADLDTRQFQVVGTWGNLQLWKEHESRFWEEILPKASNGKLTANAKPYTEVGLSGFEVMRLLKLGTYDAVHAVTTYVAQDSPELEGVDLAGVVQDLDTYRKAMEAYKEVISRELAEKYNAKLLILYSFPSQQLWCNLGDKSKKDVSLADLRGKKIRTYSTTLGDFIEGLNASAVTIAFAEVVPALQKGVADCGITGTGPAYSAKWWQVVTHNIRVRLGYAATVLAMNMDTWNSLNQETQQLMLTELAKVEDEMWASTKIADQMGMDCNASGPCPLGEPGGMVPIEPTGADQEMLKDIVQNYVLKRWADRCGKECAQEWNQTVGPVVGVKAPL